MGKEWIKIKEVGQLFLEKILVSFDVPILFVCIDFENRKYLCLNIDSENGKTIIAPIKITSLILMIKNQITMESAFRNTINNEIFIIEYDFENNRIISKIEDSRTIDKNLLPKENEFFEISNNSINDYAANLEKQIIKINIQDFKKSDFFIIPSCNYYSNSPFENQMMRKCNKIILAKTIEKCWYNISDDNKIIA